MITIGDQKRGSAVISYLLDLISSNAFDQRQHNVQKCKAKTILLSQTSVFSLLFIHF
jgi:hypothetical protein